MNEASRVVAAAVCVIAECIKPSPGPGKGVTSTLTCRCTHCKPGAKREWDACIVLRRFDACMQVVVQCWREMPA